MLEVPFHQRPHENQNNPRLSCLENLAMYIPLTLLNALRVQALHGNEEPPHPLPSLGNQRRPIDTRETTVEHQRTKDFVDCSPTPPPGPP
ncbi:unnamed protein product [Lepidochelys kempii]